MIQIPINLNDAKARLADLEGIATATGWERAAIVYAFVDRPGSGNKKSLVSRVSAADFARLGIVGLTSEPTVAHYHGAWAYAVANHDAPDVQPGGLVDLPELVWPPNPDVGRVVKDPERREMIREAAREAGMTAGSKALDIAANPRSLTVAIKSDTITAKAAAEALAATPAGRVEAQKALDKAHEGHGRVPRATPDAYSGDRYDLVAAMRKMQRAGSELLDTVPKVQADITSVERDALVSFVTWVRNYAEALDVVVRNEPIDVQLAAFLSEGGV